MPFLAPAVAVGNWKKIILHHRRGGVGGGGGGSGSSMMPAVDDPKVQTLHQDTIVKWVIRAATLGNSFCLETLSMRLIFNEFILR